MNHQSTLHQVLSAPTQWASIDQIIATWQTHDNLILLGEAAQGYNDARLASFQPIYMLDIDASLLGLNRLTQSSAHYRIVSVDDWAALILKHTKHISWK